MDARTATRPARARLDGNRVASGRNRLPYLIDVATMAERLGLPERTIRRRVAQGKIPHYKLGRSIRFDPVEIDAWLPASRIAATHATRPSSRTGRGHEGR